MSGRAPPAQLNHPYQGATGPAPPNAPEAHGLRVERKGCSPE